MEHYERPWSVQFWRAVAIVLAGVSVALYPKTGMSTPLALFLLSFFIPIFGIPFWGWAIYNFLSLMCLVDGETRWLLGARIIALLCAGIFLAMGITMVPNAFVQVWRDGLRNQGGAFVTFAGAYIINGILDSMALYRLDRPLTLPANAEQAE